MRIAAKPHLYTADSEVPVLFGAACGSCGRVYFPPLGLGCEVCGAAPETLAATALAMEGTVYAVAQVNVHRGQPTPPFTIVEVVLDGGPLIRAMLDPQTFPVRIGERVVGTWFVAGVDEQGMQTVEPAFTAAAGRVS